MSTIRVGVAQVPQTPDLAQNLGKALETMDRAADRGVQLLCFPETHLTGYRVGILEPQIPLLLERLREAELQLACRCRELSMGAIVGTETPDPEGKKKPFNSAVVFDQEGQRLVVHHKSQLTPKDALAYSPGDGPTRFEFAGIPMGIVICFEGFRFPETTRELARWGAKIVFHPQFNHVFPGMEWKKPVQESLIVARAAENTIYFVSANMCHPRNNCRSLIVGPDGLIIEVSSLRKEMLLVADLELERATHAFLLDDPGARSKALAEL